MSELSPADLCRYLQLARIDMEQTIDAVRLLRKEHGRPDYDGRRHQRLAALETAAVVSYARPFSATRFGGVKKQRVVVSLSHEASHFVELHKWLMKTRNRRSAHTDDDSGRNADARIERDRLELREHGFQLLPTETYDEIERLAVLQRSIWEREIVALVSELGPT